MISTACRVGLAGAGPTLEALRLIVACTIACLAVGCQPSASDAPATAKSDGDSSTPRSEPSSLTASDLLAKMVAAYKAANSYQDAGSLTFQVVEQGEKPQEERNIPLSVTFERPNKLRLHAFNTIVISEGVQLHATMQELPDQVVVRPAPEEFSIDDLKSDDLMARGLRIADGLDVPQLRLLTDEKPLEGAAKGTAVRLKDELLEGVQCHRVEVTGPQGKAVYWLDHRNYVVRRYEFPTAEFRRQVDPDGKIASLQVIADFDGASFNPQLPSEAFAFEVPNSVRLVKHFLLPPPRPPSPMLGRDLGDFAFVDLEGKKVDRKSLEGKIAVLDFWIINCEPCFHSFPNLQRVYQQFKDNDQVVILAVNNDKPETTDAEVRKALEEKQIHIPIVRGSEESAKSFFKVSGWPTTYVLGKDGTVQSHEDGFNPNLSEQLSAEITHLLTGANLAKDVIGKYELARDEYDQKAAEATVGTSTVVELPQTKIAEKTEPSALQLTPLWTADEIKSPGNLLLVEREGGSPMILVIDGWRMVAELDLSGKVVARHELEIPENAAVTFLRTAVNKEGQRYFAAFASGQQQVYLFDNAWKRLVSYPNPEESGPHAGISDVQLADLDGDGQPELNVGYWGAVGVQNVSLDGARQWSNRAIENVLRLAIVGPDDRDHRRILCTNGRDAVVPLDHRGKQQDLIRIPNRALHTLAAADLDADGLQELCGLVATEVGVTTAIGMGMEGQEMWNYPLPNGVHNVPVETIVAGRLMVEGPGQWLLPGADGSVHILGSDGKLLDGFNYGAAITGLAAAPLDGTPVLLVSSAKGLSAWKVAPK